MAHRHVSEDLPTAFSVTDAAARGISPDALRSVSLRTPYRGVRARSAPPHPDDLLGRCLDYAPRLRPWQFFSHETALALAGVPLPEWPYRPRIHVATHRPAREPRIGGVVGHRLQSRETATVGDAVRFEHPVRAWRQAGTDWGLDDLICAAEFLISGDEPWGEISDLRREIEVMGDTRGGILTRALRETRVGTRSPRETRLRLALVRSGLPEPEINWVLHDRSGRRIAELDLAYPRWRVCPEYDGRVHAEDARQFAHDADRWDAVRAEDWNLVRVLNHHMRGDAAAAVHKVRDALLRAGWSPHR